MAKADVASITSRRTLLGTIASVPIGAVVPAAAVAPPDSHPAWLAEWRRLHDWCNGPGPGDQDVQDLPEWQRIEALEALIVDTPAATRAGLAVQAEFALVAIANDGDEEAIAHRIEVRALRNIAAALGSAQGRI